MRRCLASYGLDVRENLEGRVEAAEHCSLVASALLRGHGRYSFGDSIRGYNLAIFCLLASATSLLDYLDEHGTAICADDRVAKLTSLREVSSLKRYGVFVPMIHPFTYLDLHRNKGNRRVIWPSLDLVSCLLYSPLSAGGLNMQAIQTASKCARTMHTRQHHSCCHHRGGLFLRRPSRSLFADSTVVGRLERIVFSRSADRVGCTLERLQLVSERRAAH
jgi:hypothetical protein